MRRIIVIAAALGLVGVTSRADAQSRWTLEASTDAAFPTEKVGNADLRTGLGFEISGRYRIQPHLAVYAGWDWHHFSTDEPLAGQKMDIEDTGYAFGLRFDHPLVSSTAGWLRFGGTANHIELESARGDLVGDSGHGLGWEAGGGLSVPIGRRLSLTPGVRYRALSRDVEIGNVATPTDLRYFTVGMGLVIAF
jgi:hypothetical protein